MSRLKSIKSVASLLESWQLVIVLAISALAALGVIIFRLSDYKAPEEGRVINSSQSGKLSVQKSQSQTLSGNTLTSNSPPQSVSASNAQSNLDPNQASVEPLQTNVNINDPSVANNSLVQSLNDY